MTSRWERGRVVTVFGASGFVGRHTVEALAVTDGACAQQGRRPDLALHLQPLRRSGTDLSGPDQRAFIQSRSSALQAVVNLVGIFFAFGPQTFEAVHVAGARTIARAVREAGIRSLVHMSAIPGEAGLIGLTTRGARAEGEDAVLRELPTGVVVDVRALRISCSNRFAAMAPRVTCPVR